MPTCYGDPNGDAHEPTSMERMEPTHHQTQWKCPTCGVVVEGSRL